MSEDLILAATAWPTNAAMIADVARLGYLTPADAILDPTYGKGGWWRLWAPREGKIYGSDIKGLDAPFPACPFVWTPGVDFTLMPYPSQEFDAVAFDPPYVSVGGRASSGMKKMHAAYGMDGTPLSPAETQQQINKGVGECWRVVKKGGIVLVKCQDYISSGKLWPGVSETVQHAELCGLKLVDHLIHLSGPGPQPKGRKQVHARRNHSDLLVFKRRKRA